jgi:hypothetical protein
VALKKLPRSPDTTAIVSDFASCFRFGQATANNPLANIVDRLRSSGFQPRKVGDDAWESRCPGHGASDLALFLSRGRDGKLVLQCRGEQNCSFSAILKKLNIKLRHLNRDMHESVIRRLRAMEVQLGLYHHPVPLVADPVVLTIPAAATVPDAATPAEDQDITAVALAVPAPESDDNTTPSSKTEPETEETYLPLQADAAVKGRETIDILNGSAQESPSREIAVLEPAADSEPSHSSAGSTPATSGDSEKTRATERLQQIAAGARPFRRPDGQYSVSIAVDGHQECHALESPEVVRWLTRRYYESAGRLPTSASLTATIRALAAHADIACTVEVDFVRVGSNGSGSSMT